MQRVAFFDIDGTVFRSSLLIELVGKLIAEGVFPPETPAEFETEYTAWLHREGAYEDYIGAVIAAFLRHIQGVHYGTLADIGRVTVAEQSRRVYRYTRDLINTLKQEDYFLVAISQSPKTILDEFCNSYGFDKSYGRMYEIGPTDRFTGRLIDEHLIEDKANIVRRVVDVEDLTLEGSVGVGDTEGDISLLESVETPICFNPNEALYTHARERGWQVVVERKDVIYTL